MKLNKLIFRSLLLVTVFTSCESVDDSVEQTEVSTTFGEGILISHEGSFSGGTGTVSYVSNDLKRVENNIFSRVNGRTLGTVAQSIAFKGDLAYIIINVSNQIEVVNRYTFKSIATITDASFLNLRYMAIANGKGYITNWGVIDDPEDDKVIILDLETYAVIGAIKTGEIPEEVISKGNKVYVATGLFGGAKVVEIIDAEEDVLLKSVELENSPNSIQFDNNGDVWVLTSKNLIEIDANTNLISRTLNFDETISSPNKLYFNNNTFYYQASNAIFKFKEEDTELPIIPELYEINFYDMSVKDGKLYGLDARNFDDKGFMKVYDLNTKNEIKSIELNLIPGEVYFN